ncbi:unnamed protein product [Adineta steineri]|uniref:Nucleoside transporter/FeoB GTPase Gate domain-containing protein n=1 Tax=Adineta steineri TaxID=433720 RepID=A0A819MYH1_9BILA|nr:unnamed protein product [Adineta steineri]
MTKNRIGRENPIFELDQQPYIINTTNGLILTSKLQSMEKEEDKNNVGFEKLPEDDHSNCLFVLKLRTILHFLVFITIAFYVGSTVTRPQNYISLIGIVVLILLGTIVNYSFNNLIQNNKFYFNNADSGAIFVFGKTFEEHFFVFKVTSIIIFLGAVINVLYYLGVMQYVIGKIAWFMQKTLNTTAAESRNAAASIFVGISEAPLMIMLLVSKMTTSELHSVLVDGFATMAGFEMKFF